MASSTFKVGQRVMVTRVISVSRFDPYLPRPGTVLEVSVNGIPRVCFDKDPLYGHRRIGWWCEARVLDGLLDV